MQLFNILCKIASVSLYPKTLLKSSADEFLFCDALLAQYLLWPCVHLCLSRAGFRCVEALGRIILEAPIRPHTHPQML